MTKFNSTTVRKSQELAIANEKEIKKILVKKHSWLNEPGLPVKEQTVEYYSDEIEGDAFKEIFTLENETLIFHYECYFRKLFKAELKVG